MVRTPGFHPGNRSSILRGITSFLILKVLFITRMENQDQKLNDHQPLPIPNSNVAQNQSPYTSLPSTSPLTDNQAQNLLTVSGLQSGKSTKPSKGILIVIVALVIVAIVTALFAHSGHHTTKSSSKGSNLSVPNANNSPLNNDSSSINQQVQYCSNIVNANTVC